MRDKGVIMDEPRNIVKQGEGAYIAYGVQWYKTVGYVVNSRSACPDMIRSGPTNFYYSIYDAINAAENGNYTTGEISEVTVWKRSTELSAKDIASEILNARWSIKDVGKINFYLEEEDRKRLDGYMYFKAEDAYDNVEYMLSLAKKHKLTDLVKRLKELRKRMLDLAIDRQERRRERGFDF
jgi:hypothetical protein